MQTWSTKKPIGNSITIPHVKLSIKHKPAVVGLRIYLLCEYKLAGETGQANLNAIFAFCSGFCGAKCMGAVFFFVVAINHYEM